ncbi:MAG TPA: hypothetical protein VL132_01805 [Planctomycetaceae bacterium]|nr:hypothetical protein [Planctomycetaceae bacterium]
MNQFRLTCLSIALVIGGGARLTADEPADARQPVNRGAPITQTDARLKSRLQGTTDPGQENPSDRLLEQAAERMRSASNRLQGGQTGQETRDEQQEAVALLDEIIKQLEQPPPPDQGGNPPPPDSQQNPPPDSQNSPRKQSPSSQSKQPPEQPESSPGKEQRTQGGKSQDSDQAEDSEERERERQRRETAELKRKKLQTDVWGHLPEHLREQLLNTYSERMLPKYEGLVRQFYERLSETPSKKSSR